MSFPNLSEFSISLTLLNSLRSFPPNHPHQFPPSFLNQISSILSNSTSSFSSSSPQIQRSYLALHYYLSIIDNIEDLTVLFNPDFTLNKPDLTALNKTNLFNIHSLLKAIVSPQEAQESTQGNSENVSLEKFKVQITQNETRADAEKLFISSDLVLSSSFLFKALLFS